MCPESVPTVSFVSRCPSNAKEWKSASFRKRCNDVGKIQKCTKAENFVYHCILNEEATALLEVCAPLYFMSGEYNHSFSVLFPLKNLFVFRTYSKRMTSQYSENDDKVANL